MKSPFPGMDPYIEACGLWEDFHNHLIQRIAFILADAVPENYLVRTGVRSYIELLEPKGERDVCPDVHVGDELFMRAPVPEEFREQFIKSITKRKRPAW